MKNLNILEFKNWIVFQSLDRFIFFDPNSEVISSIRPNGGVFKSFIIDNNLFFSINGQGILKLTEVIIFRTILMVFSLKII